jgi:hypothetical protein
MRKSCRHQLTLSLYYRFHKRRIASERRKHAVPYVWKVARIERQSGNPTDIDAKGCCLAKRRSLRSVDQKVLTGSTPAFKCDSGSRVNDNSKPLVPDSPGGQAEYDVRRWPGPGCFPKRKIAANVISGLHPLWEEFAEMG